MEEKIILPQNTRLMGALLGFIGGGLDVFCHMHYRSLVATQTGNLLLLSSVPFFLEWTKALKKEVA